MKEIAELRIPEEHARLLFSKDEGIRLGLDGTVRKIFIATNDPRYPQVGVLQKKLRAKRRFFFAGWDLNRKYTKAEFNEAQLFHFIFMPEFEPSGEECGTIYDESSACLICGVGAIQTNPLYLRKNKIPKSKDFSYTIANNEFIISKRAVDLFKLHKVTGLEYAPLYTSKRSKLPSEDWFQFFVKNTSVEISSKTRFGLKPFDDDEKGEYLCANGHKAGLNILSELTIVRTAEELKFDFMATRQYVGARAGLLRPHRLILISQKIRKIIEENNLKGCRLEVAYLE
jgi:hypothetical protein